jgi:Zn-finger nucleic acid-binding protein
MSLSVVVVQCSGGTSDRAQVSLVCSDPKYVRIILRGVEGESEKEIYLGENFSEEEFQDRFGSQKAKEDEESAHRRADRDFISRETRRLRKRHGGL